MNQYNQDSDPYNSRNPNLMNTYSSKMNHMVDGNYVLESANDRIFGKLKHRESRLPSTALDKEKNYSSMVKQKKKAKTIDQLTFISP